jgi:hypothetical protein
MKENIEIPPPDKVELWRDHEILASKKNAPAINLTLEKLLEQADWIYE